MQRRYNSGVEDVEDFCRTWQLCKPYIDEQRWQEVDARLQHQLENAKEWKKVCMNYFSSFTQSIYIIS